MFSSPPGQSSHAPYRPPNLSIPEQRQAACTHLNVTRLFDSLQSHECQICGHVSSLGWIYRCTQDSQSFLPQSDFSVTKSPGRRQRLSEQPVTHQLSQNILKHIDEGHYSTQQVQLLQAQKLRVKEVITMQEDKLEYEQLTSQSSSPINSSENTIGSPELTEAARSENLMQLNTNIRDQVIRTPDLEQIGSHLSTLFAPRETDFESLAPRCHFKCCQNCRPGYRDRAFQSLDALLTNSFQPPPQWELENRRLSDAKILTEIRYPLSQSQLSGTDQECEESSKTTAPHGFASNEDEVVGSKKTNSTGRRVRRRIGFKDTVRKALGTTPQPKLLREASKDSSNSSSREPSIQVSQTASPSQSTMPTGKEAQVVSNEALQESLVLKLATNTPLPPAFDDSDSLDDGEIKVEDGIAVTEEGVEMGAADIIMQT